LRVHELPLQGCGILVFSFGLQPDLPRSVWVHLDSNQGPAGYEPDALTAELWTQGESPLGWLASIAHALARLAGDRPLLGEEAPPGGGETGGERGLAGGVHERPAATGRLPPPEGERGRGGRERQRGVEGVGQPGELRRERERRAQRPRHAL